MPRSSRVALVLVALAVAGCGTTGGGSGDGSSEPTRTVTVTSSPSERPSAFPSPSATAIPTPIPTATSSAPATGIPTTYAAGQAVVARSSIQQGTFGAFVTPSGNIYCSADVPGSAVACELASDGISDPAVCTGGMRTTVGRLELASDGTPRPICNSDTIRTQQDLEPLAYGTAVRSSAGAVVCASESVGVTCVDTATRTGFFLNRTTYRLLR